MRDYKLLIDGQLVDGDLEMEIINPATTAVLATCPRASEAQLDLAVAAAKAAFVEWRRTSFTDRIALIQSLAGAVLDRADQLARLLVSEQGKPLDQALAEVHGLSAFMNYLQALELPNLVDEGNPARRLELRRKPLGVVACIAPWNFPLLIGVTKAAFALAAGNTVVLKPAPTTPLTTLLVGELCADIFPPGVINIITDLNDLGAALTAHPDVAKISFTGSTETGRRVMASAAASIKRVTLELGGNDAAIVLADANPKEIAPAIFGSAMLNAGQVCIAIKRVYAHASIYDELCDELGKLADAAIVDDGFAQGVQIGPLQNKVQFEKVRAYLEGACRDGKVVAGGTVVDRVGYFVRPTIVRDVARGHSIVDEEQFGPILPVISFEDPLSAVEEVNDSPYGLAGSVWSADMDVAYAIAKEMDSGTVWINKHLEFGPDVPFGGAKQSGLGVEFAAEGLLEFTQLQVINAAR